MNKPGILFCPTREQLVKLNWTAIFAAAEYYTDCIWDNDATTYDREGWLLENYGIDHRAESISIVDESKYMMLVLRFGS